MVFSVMMLPGDPNMTIGAPGDLYSGPHQQEFSKEHQDLGEKENIDTVLPDTNELVQSREMPSDHRALPWESCPSSPHGPISLLLIVALVHGEASFPDPATCKQLHPRGFRDATFMTTWPVLPPPSSILAPPSATISMAMALLR